MYGRASSSRPPIPTGLTEFDILKASHKFLREDDNPNANTDADGNANTNSNGSWGQRLAQKYYESLYREFAVCDLKHYKSGNFALRWRTEEEVLKGAGEETCGNTRCPLHFPSSTSTSTSMPTPGLKTVELPFAYEEHGERKSALVKVVLCDACLRKLMWKREREKKARERRMIEDGGGGERYKEERVRKEERGIEPAEKEQEGRLYERRRDRHEGESSSRDRRKVRSRSRSPSRHRRKHEDKDKSKSHRHGRSPVS
ncbi:hypothetical protein ACEPAG_7051 [Sanghuangporus baumii]